MSVKLTIADHFRTVLVLGLLLLLSAGCSREARKARHLERANRYFQAEQYDRAEIEYRNALRFEPYNPIAIRQLGIIFYNQGKMQPALSVLHKAKELQPDNLDVRLKLGRAYLWARMVKEAREEALFLLGKQPANDEVMMLLVETSTTPKEIDDTRQRLQNLRQQIGNTAGFHLGSGLLASRQQDFKGAESALQQALALDPKSSAAHIALGNLYWSQGNLKQADQSLKMGADLAPPRSSRRTYYAEFKIRTGDLESGKRLLEEITKKTPDYVPAWMRQAEIAFAEKKYDHSASLAKKVLAKDGFNYDALLLGGQLKMAQGDATNAIAQYERIRTLYPKVPQVFYQLGVAHLLNKDLPKASSSLSEAVTLDPNYADAIMLLAELNIRKGDLTVAITSLTQLIKQQPKLMHAHLLLADAYRARNNLDEAAGVYRRLAEMYPQNARIPLLLGLVYVSQKKPIDARRAFEKAAELAPDDASPLDQLVDLDLAEQQYGIALQRVQKVIEKLPKAPVPYVLLAKIHVAQKDVVQAEADLLQAIQLEPNYRDAYFLLARLYVQSKKHQQALEKLQGVIAKSPKDVTALMQMGMIYSELNDFAAARDTYEKLLAINPRFSLALNNLAYLYSERFGQLGKAYDMAGRAREILPNEPATADTFGWILFKRGEYPRALALLQESAEKLFAEPEVLFHLGMAHYMMGEEEAARIALQRSLQTNKEFPGKDEAGKRLSLLTIDIKSAGPQVIKDLEKSLDEQPDDPILLGHLAALYERDGAVDKAVKACEKALKRNSKNVSAMLMMARLYSERLNNRQKALELAKTAHGLAPEDAHVSHILGRLAYQSGDHKWALSLLQESARKLSKEAGVLYDLAWSYYTMGRLPDAEATMQSVLQTGGSFSNAPAARQFLAIHGIYNHPENAQRELPQILQILKADPNYLPALLVTGLIHEQQGNVKAAQQVYESILGHYPFFSPVNKRLASLYADFLGDNQKAYEHAQKAREAFPDDPEVARTLGLVAYRRGDYSRSIDLLKESSRKRPADAELFFHLGMAHYQLKQNPQSKEALRQALALNLPAKLAENAKQVLAQLK